MNTTQQMSLKRKLESQESDKLVPPKRRKIQEETTAAEEETHGCKESCCWESSDSDSDEESKVSDEEDSFEEPLSECDCNRHDCDTCEEIRVMQEKQEIKYMLKWKLGGCRVCRCTGGPADCSTLDGSACDGCMTGMGQFHYDYEVRLLPAKELALRPELEPIEKVMKKPLEEYTDRELYHIRKYIHLDLKDTVNGKYDNCY